MKRIKRFNEMFDTEELKAQNEIPMLQGNLLKGKLGFTSKESIDDLREKVIYTFPFLEKFGQWEDKKKYKDIVFFQQKNDYWYANIAFSVEGNGKYGVGMLYKYLDTTPNAPLKNTLAFSGKDYTYYTEWTNKTFDEITKLVNTYYIPLLNRLGFEEEMSHAKQVSKRKFN